MSYETTKSRLVVSLVTLTLFLANLSHSIGQEKQETGSNEVPLVYQKLSGDLRKDNMILKALLAESELRLANANENLKQCATANFELEAKLRKSYETQHTAERSAENSQLEIEVLRNQITAMRKYVDDWRDKADQDLRTMDDHRTELRNKLLELNKTFHAESRKLTVEANLMLEKFLCDQETNEIRLFAGSTYFRQIDQYPKVLKAGYTKKNVESLVQAANRFGEESEIGALAKKLVSRLVSDDPFAGDPFDSDNPFN